MIDGSIGRTSWDRVARWLESPATWVLLAVVYASLIAVRSGVALYGDELRYLQYAQNLADGFYARPGDGAIRNGPGVPLLMLPFVAFGAEGTALRFLNVPLLLLALFYSHRLLRRVAGERLAAIGTVFLAVHPSLLLYGTRALSELPALVLLMGFGFFLERHLREPRERLAWWLAALHLALLALTKVSYGYGIAVLLVLFAVLRLHPPSARLLFARASVGTLLAAAMLGCVPYLTYTWIHSGKLFYWGTNGGETLYWMSVEGEGLWGSWLKADVVAEHPDLAAEHLPFLQELRELSAVERDERFRQRAISNIRSEPEVYMRHWTANVSRLLFNLPYSRRESSLGALVLLVPNALLLVLALRALVLCSRRSSPGGRSFTSGAGWLPLLCALALVVFAGNTLPSNTGRQFVPAIPVLVLWLAAVEARCGGATGNAERAGLVAPAATGGG